MGGEAVSDRGEASALVEGHANDREGLHIDMVCHMNIHQESF
jgi:hypothetical protein